MILRLLSEPIVPRETVAYDKATQNIVRANDAHHAECEERESDAVREKGLVVDESDRDRSASTLYLDCERSKDRLTLSARQSATSCARHSQ